MNKEKILQYLEGLFILSEQLREDFVKGISTKQISNDLKKSFSNYCPKDSFTIKSAGSTEDFLNCMDTTTRMQMLITNIKNEINIQTGSLNKDKK